MRLPRDQASTESPDNPEALFAFGRERLEADDIEAARAAFARVVELDPGHVRAWINYGAACGESGQPDEAARALGRALEIDPSSRDAASNLGVLRREAGRLDEAEALARRVLAMDPAFVFGYYNLAHCLFLAGRFDEAADQYRAGLKRDPQKTPNQNARLAWALLALGEDKPARRELKRALLRLAPEEHVAFLEEADEVLGALETSFPGADSMGAVRRLIADSLR